MVSIKTTGSTLFRVDIIDRYKENGVIKSKELTKFFKGDEEKEAYRYFYGEQDKHYMIEMQFIQIHIATRINESLNCH